jgi:hypothetical protein
MGNSVANRAVKGEQINVVTSWKDLGGFNTWRAEGLTGKR